MNLTKLIKREIILTLSTLFLITIGFFAVSLAYFLDVEEGSTNVISFGDINLSLCADATCDTTVSNIGNIIGTENDGNGNYTPVAVYPTSDSEGLLTTPYRFILENTGDYDLSLTIKLEPDTSFILSSEFPEFEGYTETSYDNVKIALNKENLTPTIKLYSDLTEYKLAENIILASGSTEIYELRAWVDDSVPNTAIGTYFVTTIQVIGEYIPE